ncbi:MAG TPA: hypothetical protein VEK37_14210 [Gemmatimonadaceae bacterium]|nr:hypothetical protein [Gemmatimonadaceae bacterium]
MGSDALASHNAAIIAPLAGVFVIWYFQRSVHWLADRGSARAAAFLAGYARADFATRLAAMLLLADGLVHLAIALGRAELDPLTAVLLVADAALLLASAVFLFVMVRARLVAGCALVLTMIAYCAYLGTGREMLDDIGVATYLLEWLALTLIWPRRRA